MQFGKVGAWNATQNDEFYANHHGVDGMDMERTLEKNGPAFACVFLGTPNSRDTTRILWKS